jgi:hypothetical protein
VRRYSRVTKIATHAETVVLMVECYPEIPGLAPSALNSRINAGHVALMEPMPSQPMLLIRPGMQDEVQRLVRYDARER